MRISDETIAGWYTGIVQDEPEAISEFYAFIQKVYGHDRYLLVREAYGDSIQDVLHDSFIDVVATVRAGKLRVPTALLGLAHVVIRRTGIQNLRRVKAVRESRCLLGPDVPGTEQAIDKRLAESEAAQNQKQKLVSLLNTLDSLDRTVLERFYLDGHDRGEISQDLGLTYNQFRNVKHRAKLQLLTKEKYASSRSKAAAA